MKTRLIGYLYLAAAMTSVGSTVIASRLAANGLPPFTAVAPVSAVLFAVTLCGDTLTGTRLAGFALVLAGMLVGALRRRPGTLR